MKLRSGTVYQETLLEQLSDLNLDHVRSYLDNKDLLSFGYCSKLLHEQSISYQQRHPALINIDFGDLVQLFCQPKSLTIEKWNKQFACWIAQLEGLSRPKVTINDGAKILGLWAYQNLNRNRVTPGAMDTLVDYLTSTRVQLTHISGFSEFTSWFVLRPRSFFHIMMNTVPVLLRTHSQTLVEVNSFQPFEMIYCDLSWPNLKLIKFTFDSEVYFNFCMGGIFPNFCKGGIFLKFLNNAPNLLCFHISGYINVNPPAIPGFRNVSMYGMRYERLPA